MIATGARPLHFVLLGPPASGKGTQGRGLASALALDYLSTGALLREQVESGTELGKLASPILARGGYLPDELMFPIVTGWLERHSRGWVLDGFPRSLPQARFLDGWLADRGMKLDAAISLEAPFSELVGRIRNRVECPACRWTGQRGEASAPGACPKCGLPVAARADDTEGNFRNRFAEFEAAVAPVIRHYRRAGILSPCDATAPREQVAAEILRDFVARPA